jgi:hypothetical protein
MAKKPEYETELQWKNWLVFINDTSNAIEELRRVGEFAYYDNKYLNTLFAKISVFVSTRKPYISNYVEINKKLKAIGETLFSYDYLKDVGNNKSNVKLKQVQYNIMSKLNEIIGEIIEQLSNNEILPKITKTNKSIPGAVRIN